MLHTIVILLFEKGSLRFYSILVVYQSNLIIKILSIVMKFLTTSLTCIHESNFSTLQSYRKHCKDFDIVSFFAIPDHKIVRILKNSHQSKEEIRRGK